MLIGTGPDAYMKGMRKLALLILAALVMATILAGCGGAGSGALHRLPKSSRRREPPPLRSRRPKARDLPSKLRENGSGTLRSGARMHPWF